jgi:Bacterial Ig-like domain (group 2)
MQYNDGTFPVEEVNMHMRSMFTLASFLAIAACDSNHQLAGLNEPGAGGGGTIPPFPVAPLLVSPSAVQMPLGTTVQLTTNALPENQSQLQWISFNPTIATVSQIGLVRAVGVGITSIVVRYAFDTTNVAAATINAGPPVAHSVGGMPQGSPTP